MLRYLINAMVLTTSAGALATPVKTLETLLVVGEVSADAFPVLPGEAISNREWIPPSSLKDSASLLEQLPGVQVDSRSNYAQDTRLTLRGFGARSAFGVRGVDLQVDGVPLSTPDGQGQLSSVMLDAVSRVQVLRGPMAALYGNASGGVILMQTEAPNETAVAVSVIGGADGLRKQQLKGQWQQDKLGVKLGVSSMKLDGIRAHSAAERRHLHSAVHYQADNGVETVFRFDMNDDPRLDDPLGLTPEEWAADPYRVNPMADRFDTHKTIEHQQTSLTLRKSEGAQRWQTSLWYSDRDMTQLLGFAGDAITSAGGIVALQREVAGLSGRYSRDDSLGSTALTTTLGAEWSQMNDRRRGYVNQQGARGDLRRDEDGQVDSADAYVLLQWQLLPSVMLSGGARYSDIRFEVDDFFILPGNPDDSGAMEFGEWSSALAVQWQWQDNWQLHASYGTGFETPTLTEAAYRLEGTGLNVALEAADIKQYEAGLGYQYGGLQWTATAFDIDTTNEIVVDRSVDGRTFYRNAAATRRHGVELAGQWMSDARWGVTWTMNWLDATFDAGEWQGKYLPGIARENHSAGVILRPWQAVDLSFHLLVRHRSRVAVDDANSDFAPSATTADAAISWAHRHGPWQMSTWVNLANISDRVYVGSVIVNQSNRRAFESAAGRSFSAGIDLGYRW